ncbi:MAG TPA: CbiX/SirB N-terminal domain-containing protein [Candidatus Omnitrophota bacterium]|nr:CbiX/SirB N-terminal domain-containing protein [Candidatus Omnitrophota bacterium]
MKAALVISHGSRSSKTKEEVAALIRKIKKRSSITIIEYAFLELESPDISTGIGRCIDKGATDILIMLNFLNAGRHVDQNVPAIIRKTREKFPSVKIKISKPIGQHKGIVDLFVDSIQSA